MMIKCDGQLFNPCKGLTDDQAKATFAMYAGPRPSNSYRWTLHDDSGRVVDERTSETAKGGKK